MYTYTYVCVYACIFAGELAKNLLGPPGSKVVLGLSRNKVNMHFLGREHMYVCIHICVYKYVYTSVLLGLSRNKVNMHLCLCL